MLRGADCSVYGINVGHLVLFWYCICNAMHVREHIMKNHENNRKPISAQISETSSYENIVALPKKKGRYRTCSCWQ